MPATFGQSPTLAAERHGSGERLVLVHGFTQTARSWHPVAHDLQYHYEVVAVDLPDHGRSRDLHAESLDDAARALGATGGQATYVGYSLGGRVALTLALQDPGLVERLVLVGATPGIADPAERAARRASDEQLAAQIDESFASDPNGALDAFLEQWLGQALFAHLTPEQQDRPARRNNTPNGLARSLRTVGTGTQVPSHDRLGELTMPVLLVVGAGDEKFTAIAKDMAQRIGDHATLVIVDDASHAVPFENRAGFVKQLAEWLAATSLH